MSELITGTIYFASAISCEELTELSYFLLGNSISHKIGFNICYNLSINALDKYSFQSDRYPPCEITEIAYEITEAPWTSVSDGVFNGIGYEDKTFKLVCVERSQLPNIQKFLENIIKHEKILYITIELENAHDFDKIEIEYKINANQFCKSVINIVNETGHWQNTRLKIIS